MNKIIVNIISIILIALFPAAIAESFELNNGIAMGMGIDEVTRCEKRLGSDCKQEELVYTYYGDDGQYYSGPTKGLVASGSFQGIQGSKTNYYFDENDNLFDIVSFIGPDHYREFVSGRELMGSNVINEYDTIEKQLAEHYGDTWEEISDQTPSTIDYIIADQLRVIEIYDYSLHRVMLSENEAVNVFHVLTYTDLSSFGSEGLENNVSLTGMHLLEYRLITTID